jgi:hypothetical protein
MYFFPVMILLHGLQVHPNSLDRIKFKTESKKKTYSVTDGEAREEKVLTQWPSTNSSASKPPKGLLKYKVNGCQNQPRMTGANRVLYNSVLYCQL